MPEIKLKKALTHDGKTYEVLDFDPSLDAIAAFEREVKGGGSEVEALKVLFSHDGDFPAELVGQLRASDLTNLVAAMPNVPFGAGSPASGTGEVSRQT